MDSSPVIQKLDEIQRLAQTKLAEHSARLLQIEQLATRGGGGGSFGSEGNLGEIVVASDGFQNLKRGSKESGKITVSSFHKAITSPGGQNQPLVPDMRVAGIIPPGLRPLTIRDLLSQNRTTSNLVQFTRENVFTNAAAPQMGEGVAKAQSDMTFTLANAPVQTLSHWIGASVQVLDDAIALSDYINSRMLYGLKLVEENQILNGDGPGKTFPGSSPIPWLTAAVLAARMSINWAERFRRLARAGLWRTRSCSH
jgi:HK97 family phage major capsid protein